MNIDDQRPDEHRAMQAGFFICIAISQAHDRGCPQQRVTKQPL